MRVNTIELILNEHCKAKGGYNMLIYILKQTLASIDAHFTYDELLNDYGVELVDALDVLRSYCNDDFDEVA